MFSWSLYGSLGSRWEIPVIKLFNHFCHTRNNHEELQGSFVQYLGHRV